MRYIWNQEAAEERERALKKICRVCRQDLTGKNLLEILCHARGHVGGEELREINSAIEHMKKVLSDPELAAREFAQVLETMERNPNLQKFAIEAGMLVPIRGRADES